MSDRVTLDVETDAQREQRLGALFSSMTEGREAPGSMPMPGQAGQGPSRPYAMPESDVMARARAFLPQLAESNAQLKARVESGESVGIDGGLVREREEKEAKDADEERSDEDSDYADADEGGDDSDEEGSDYADAEGEEGAARAESAGGRMVEMDVGVGVFDVKGEAGSADLGPVVERDASVWEGKPKGE